jgi:Fe-S cluster biogenesis protein NfuA
VHPDAVERRVARALDGLRRELAPLGRDVTLTRLDGGVAEILLGGSGSGCGGPSTAELQDVVRDVVLGVAPELAEVRVPVEHAPAAFVPLDALLRAPAAPGAAR